jgi:hypothetical protein
VLAMLSLGTTVECARCGIKVFVLAEGVSLAQVECCQLPMQLSVPGPCSSHLHRSRRDQLHAGGVYREPLSGFLVRCTRGGGGLPTVAGRGLEPVTGVSSSKNLLRSAMKLRFVRPAVTEISK